MLPRSEPACLVIADISGYTSYLAGTELDHAQDILADLMSTVVSALRPTFRLAKLEGDAAFVYVLTEAIDGSLLQDTIERCYFSFRRRLRDIRQASTCDCNACILIPSLNLKLVAHHGDVARQRIAGRDELAGSAVIVLHRLLKNRVEEDLGLTAYALYSEACLGAMAIGDPAGAGLTEHRQTYDVGELVVWVRDLEAAWVAEEARSRVFVEPGDAVWSFETIYPGPPPLVWDWVTSPARRPRWQTGVTAIEEASPGGRRGTGTTNHCMHGRDAVVEEILDWRPFEYVTQRFQMPIPGMPKMTMTEQFEAIEGGTRVTARTARVRGAKARLITPFVSAMFTRTFESSAEALRPLIAADLAARDAMVAGAHEPELPESAGRPFQVPVPAGAAEASVELVIGRSSS
jgi:uncharacterized protein YndB with AHSA1/START domain